MVISEGALCSISSQRPIYTIYSSFLPFILLLLQHTSASCPLDQDVFRDSTFRHQPNSKSSDSPASSQEMEQRRMEKKPPMGGQRNRTLLGTRMATKQRTAHDLSKPDAGRRIWVSRSGLLVFLTCRQAEAVIIAEIVTFGISHLQENCQHWSSSERIEKSSRLVYISIN